MEDRGQTDGRRTPRRVTMETYYNGRNRTPQKLGLLVQHTHF